ncbi:hypothetical protein ACH5RR_021829 [Cinchona calisaya]|uniref:Uncharacterized protein n=1 Tax=Cinchona calisaya TaxID=153742 RepID=A0ABD2Z9B3_9GENT
MGSIFESFQQKKKKQQRQQGLPLSHRSHVVKYYDSGSSSITISTNKRDIGEEEQSGQLGGIRRRMQPSSHSRSYDPSSWGPKEVGGRNSIRKWWEWGWAWILSRKPTFSKDVEMNEDETAALGWHNKGSWSHVFFKLKSLVGGWTLYHHHHLPL